MKVNAIPTENFIQNDWAIAMQMGVEIIALMTVIGGALAVLLTGFTIYTNTARKEGELAVMKALGFRNRAIYGSVIVQAGVLALLGFLCAGSLASIQCWHFKPEASV